uniref:Cyanocobalamin reductase (cyanide-eliminating) n=1 Tax=Rhabditophanes sp. KR3021 TaxID=114890 RepID=A0AC35UE93_9BILA
MFNSDKEQVSKILQHLNDKLRKEDGFEIYPINLREYNRFVGKEFHLPNDENTFGVVVLSTPLWFPRKYQTWIKQIMQEKVLTQEEFQEAYPDPIKQCFEECFDEAVRDLDDQRPTIIHDFTFLANRKPKMIMAAAGHASGATYYYTKNECPELLPSDEDRISAGKKKLIGIAMHPKYGGHFAFRCVILFEKVMLTDLELNSPVKAIEDKEEIARLILSFNDLWRTGDYRNMGETNGNSYAQKYTEIQMKYWNSPPAERYKVILEMVQTVLN